MKLIKSLISCVVLLSTCQHAMAFDLIESRIKSGNDLCLLLDTDTSVTAPLTVQSVVTAETSYYAKKSYRLSDQITHTAPASHCYDVKTIRDHYIDKVTFKAESANRLALSNCTITLKKNQLNASKYTITFSNANNAILCRVH